MDMGLLSLSTSFILALSVPILSCIHAIRKRRREEGPSFEPAPKRQRAEEAAKANESGDVPLVQEPPIHLPENALDYHDLSDIVQLGSPDPHLDMEEAMYAQLCNEITNLVFSILESRNLYIPPCPYASLEEILSFSLLEGASLEFHQSVRDELLFHGTNSTYFFDFMVNVAREMLLF